MPETITRVCSAHGVETRLQCAECGDPICLRCQVRTAVGLKCARCAALPASAVPRLRRRSLLAALVGSAAVSLVAGVIAYRVVNSGSAPATITPPAPVGHWRSTPDLTVIRGGTSAVLLRNGQVLAVGGGVGSIPLAGTEVFDPTAQRWSPSGSLHHPRRGNGTVVLADGRVLTAGGIAAGRVVDTAETWDPSTGAWTEVAPMNRGRFNMILTILGDGRVLAAGGTDASTSNSLSSAEIYDPRANTWTVAPGALLTSRSDAAAVLLPDKRVLIAGGFTEQNGNPQAIAGAEIFDPVVGVFTRAASMRQARQDFTLTLLNDGRALAAGGSAGTDALGSAELFDPSTGSWTATGSMFQPRRLQSASRLADGSVLEVGGEFVVAGSRSSLTSAEIYQPASGQWRPAVSASCPRSAQAQVTLRTGSVLVLGGDAAFPGEPPRAQSCSELFTP